MFASRALGLGALALVFVFASAANAQLEGPGNLSGPRGASGATPSAPDSAQDATQDSDVPANGDPETPPADDVEDIALPPTGTPADASASSTPELGDSSTATDGATNTENASGAATLVPPPPSDVPPAAVPPAPRRGYALGLDELAAGEARVPAQLATRIRVLDQSLGALSARGGNGILDGVLSLLSGGLSIGIGIWLTVDTTDQAFANYLFLLGSVSVARGVLNLALRPNATPYAIEYGHMPMRNLAEVEARVAYGEEALETLARRSRIMRILDASLSMAAGVAAIPFFATSDGFPPSDPLDYFLIIWSGVSVVTGIIDLATRSSAERRWSAYEDLRERLDPDQLETALAAPARGLRFERAGFSALPNGGAVMVGFSL